MDQTVSISTAGRGRKSVALVKTVPGTSSLSVFYFGEVDGSSLVDGEDFVTVASWWHAKKVERHLRNKWDVEVQSDGPGLGDITMVKHLNRNPTWMSAESSL